MAVTIKDLARETGLTAATISAYFNGASVRSYNREKIERAIDKLGYIRNDYARALRTHRSMTIGVLIPELSNMFFTGLVTEIEEALRLKRYGLIICDCRSDPSREREAVKFLQSKTVDGIIVMPATDSASSLKASTGTSGVPKRAAPSMQRICTGICEQCWARASTRCVPPIIPIIPTGTSCAMNTACM